MAKTDREIVLHDDYPFREDVLRAQRNGASTYVREQEFADGSKQKITVIVERKTNKTPFIMLYKHKEMLRDLSPPACKLMMHMAITMEYGAQQVSIKRPETGLGRRLFTQGMVELMSHRVLSRVQGKRELYWVNVTVLIMGVTKEIEN